MNGVDRILTVNEPFKTNFYDGSTPLEMAAFEKEFRGHYQELVDDDKKHSQAFCAYLNTQAMHAAMLAVDLDRSISFVLQNLPEHRELFEEHFAASRECRAKRELGIPVEGGKKTLRVVK